MTQFQAQSTADLATIKARLAEVETDLQAVEAAAPTAALRVALGRPEDGDAAIVARLSTLRGEADTLRLALAAADQAERDRLEANKKREQAAQLRACQQHLSRAQKEADKISVHLTNIVGAFDRLTEASRAAYTLIPARDRADAMALSPKYLEDVFWASFSQANATAGRPFVRLPDHSDFGRSSSFGALVASRVTANLKGVVRNALASIEPVAAVAPAVAGAAGSGRPPPPVEPAALIPAAPRAEFPHVEPVSKLDTMPVVIATVATSDDDPEVIDLRGVILRDGVPKSGVPDTYEEATIEGEAA